MCIFWYIIDWAIQLAHVDLITQISRGSIGCSDKHDYIDELEIEQYIWEWEEVEYGQLLSEESSDTPSIFLLYPYDNLGFGIGR